MVSCVLIFLQWFFHVRWIAIVMIPADGDIAKHVTHVVIWNTLVLEVIHVKVTEAEVYVTIQGIVLRLREFEHHLGNEV